MAEVTTCKVCKRQYADGDDWCNSPDYVSVCGRLALDPEEDATAEIECLTFANAQLLVRLREAGDRQRAWGVERAQFERTLGHLRAEQRGLELGRREGWVAGDGSDADVDTLAWVAFGDIVGQEPYRRMYTITGGTGWFTVNGHRFDHGTATRYWPIKAPPPPVATEGGQHG